MNLQNKTVSILGCGWLGLPLAKFLIEHKNDVKGSSTSPDKLSLLESNGIKPYLIRLDPEPKCEKEELEDFLSSEILIINIPPGTRKNPGSDYHVRQMQGLAPFLKDSPLRKVVYISSTSVYPDLDKIVQEGDLADKNQAGNKVLFDAEQIILSISQEAVVLRCGGLTGYDRILVNYFAGKTNLSGGNNPVNLIHRDDLVRIVSEVCAKHGLNKVYNVCAPGHPLRKIYYPHIAKKLGMQEPQYKEEDASGYKLIEGSLLQKELDYKFLYPDPMTFDFQP
ncbi:hypothetical protein RCC89_00100 [Cytophagaceae bacterium ABcell3]|nr:hypothetical protein RCC89_00100 [Cytophagaceae bacterium ABcell3]